MNNRKCNSCAARFTCTQQHSEQGFLCRVQPRHRVKLQGPSPCHGGSFYSLASARPCCGQFRRLAHQAKSVCWPAAGLAMVAPSYSPHGCRKYRTRAARHGRLVLATNQSRAMQHPSLARRRVWPARRGLTLYRDFRSSQRFCFHCQAELSLGSMRDGRTNAMPRQRTDCHSTEGLDAPGG